MDNLRRFYNRIDRFFDRKAVKEAIHQRHSDKTNINPVTAKEAYSLCLPLVHQFDRNAQLKLLTSTDGNIQVDGTSNLWEFFFDLPACRAKASCNWHLLWNEQTDSFTGANIEFRVTPFPPPESQLHNIITEGKLLHKQLNAMWKEENNRKATLPNIFKNSDSTLKDFVSNGLDINQTNVTLKAECDTTNRPYWYAEGGDVCFQTLFV